jgi:type I restriction enzyme S subunit
MEVRPGYKLTEVGVIPEDWGVEVLTSVARKITDGDHVTPRRTSYGYYLLSARNVLNGRIDVSDVDYVGVTEYQRMKRRCDPEAGDILISCSGTIGRICVIPIGFDCVLVRSAALVKIDNKLVNSFFLQFWLQGTKAQTQIIESVNQGAQPNLFLNHIERLACPKPLLPEQCAIATALSDMDALLDGLDRLIAKKRAIKQAAMQQLLTGQTRLPGFSGAWEVKRLGDVAHIQRGASPRPIDSPLWFDDNSRVGWVRISDVTNASMYLGTTTQRLSEEGIRHSRLVQSGSLIMSICATVGRPIITNINVCIHDGFVVFDELNADRKFIYYVLTAIEPSWSKHGQTGSQMNLNTGLINSTSIDLPQREEQTAIASVLSGMDAEITALETRRAKTRAIKQAMMQELLTGRTRLLEPREADHGR